MEILIRTCSIIRLNANSALQSLRGAIDMPRRWHYNVQLKLRAFSILRYIHVVGPRTTPTCLKSKSRTCKTVDLYNNEGTMQQKLYSHITKVPLGGGNCQQPPELCPNQTTQCGEPILSYQPLLHHLQIDMTLFSSLPANNDPHEDKRCFMRPRNVCNLR